MLLGYARVSTFDQVEGTSLETQENIIRGYAMAKGIAKFDISIYVDDGVSGSIPLSMRPAGRRMLDDAKPGDIIIASKLDRMFRSALDALDMVKLLAENKINLVLFDLSTEFLAESAIGKLFFTMLAAFAEFERAIIKERMGGGKLAKKKKGGFLGGTVPYGFTVEGEGKEAMLISNSKEQELIDTLKEWEKETPGLPIREITRRLGYQRFHTREGTELHPFQVKRLLDRHVRASG